MEGLTRLVSESLARHGFDRPLDYRHLRWSRWFRCESHHSLLVVPSKPGVFALAEEIMDFAEPVWDRVSDPVRPSEARQDLVGSTPAPRRMLAVTQFFEDDDMAFVLDRMLSRQNPMAARLASGRYFVRFVVIEDQTQRRSICNALNQWMVSAAEKATGIGSHFASSLELTPATEYIPQPDDRQQSLFSDPSPNGQSPTKVMWDRVSDPVGPSAARLDFAGSSSPQKKAETPLPAAAAAPHLDSGAATNIHCPSPFPSGF